MQEADAEDHAEGQQPRAQQAHDPLRLLALRRAPDAVERALQLGEHRGGADQQQHHADHRADDALALQACTLLSRPSIAIAPSSPRKPAQLRR